jgi:hypothetical protein
MKRLFLAMAVACAFSTARADYDPGGSIFRADAHGQDQLVAWAIEAKRTGIHRIARECASACLFRLAIPQACIVRGGWMGVHGVTDQNGRLTATSAQTMRVAFIRYPRLSRFVQRSGALNRVEVTWWPTAVFHAHGVPYCDDVRTARRKAPGRQQLAADSTR